MDGQPHGCPKRVFYYDTCFDLGRAWLHGGVKSLRPLKQILTLPSSRGRYPCGRFPSYPVYEGFGGVKENPDIIFDFLGLMH